MILLATEYVDGAEVGELLVVSAVSAANVVRDIQANIRNLTGGKMAHYEKLIEQATERGLEKMAEKAKARGYHGVLALKIAHPTVVEGGVEILIYGNGFKTH